MPQLAHRAFIHQPDGVVYVGDGNAEAIFDKLADFVALEPAYALPEGLVSLNVEMRGETALVIGQAADGAVMTDIDAAPYLALIAKAPAYAATLEARKAPLYGVTNVVRAREIMTALVVTELEQRSSAAFALWPAHERNTFEQQLAEAAAYLTDNQAATPLLDAIKLEAEDKDELAQAIVGYSAAFKGAMGQLMGAKRRHLAAIAVADLDTLLTYDVKAGWPA